MEVEGNRVSGVGPSVPFQFGVYIAHGAVGQINSNTITEGPCGTLSYNDCYNARSEGITLAGVGDGTVVDHNVITHAQSGIFINGVHDARITDNLISDIDNMDGMDIQAFTNSLVEGNIISNIQPLNENCSSTESCCGINEFSGSGDSGNTISHNTVNDAYCGVAFVTADHVKAGVYHNTLYTELNEDLYPVSFPPPVEP